jgi:hypothetical protein
VRGIGELRRVRKIGDQVVADHSRLSCGCPNSVIAPSAAETP